MRNFNELKISKGQAKRLFRKGSTGVLLNGDKKTKLVSLDSNPQKVDIGVINNQSENLTIPDNLKTILKTGLPCHCGNK